LPFHAGHKGAIGAAGFHGSIGFIGAIGAIGVGLGFVDGIGVIAVGFMVGVTILLLFSDSVIGVRFNDDSFMSGSVMLGSSSGVVDAL
jgi:hypothetical protein